MEFNLSPNDEQLIKNYKTTIQLTYFCKKDFIKSGKMLLNWIIDRQEILDETTLKTIRDFEKIVEEYSNWLKEFRKGLRIEIKRLKEKIGA